MQNYILITKREYIFLNGPIPASFFAYCRPFLITIIQIENSVDGVLGIRTQGRRMVDVDKTTELWQPLRREYLYSVNRGPVVY